MSLILSLAISFLQNLSQVSEPTKQDLAANGYVWRLCVEMMAKEYAAQQDSADTLALAAVSKCNSAEQKVRETAQKYFSEVGYGEATASEMAESTVSKQKTKLRENAIVNIVDARAKIGKRR